MRPRVLVGMLVAGAAITLAAQANDPVAVNRSSEIYYFSDTATVTVESVTLNFFPTEGGVLGDPRKEGKQFVRVALSVANTDVEPFSMNYTNFELQTSNGTRHSTTSSINKGNSNDRLESAKITTGDSVSGALYYEVSGDETRDTLTFIHTGRLGTDHKDTLIPLSVP